MNYDPYGMFGGDSAAGVDTVDDAVEDRPRSRTRPAPLAPRPAAPAPTRRRPPGRPPRPAVAYRRPSPPRPPRRRVSTPDRRLTCLLIVFVLLFAVVVGRLAQLQVVDRGRLEALGAANVERTVTLPADRGAILDRNGNELAISLPRKTVMADPRYVDDPQAAATELARILDADRDELALQLSTDSSYVYLSRQVEDDVAARISRADIPGVYLIDEPARFEPAGSLAHAVLGSVAIDGTGRAGLELRYDDVLAGEPGSLEFERDAGGRTIPQGGRHMTPAVAGDDLELTIDLGMQYATEQALLAQVERTGANGAWAIVSNPRTGEIYAMATVDRPGTAEGPEGGEGSEQRGAPQVSGANAALTTVYEPGSVNKVITMAGALEEGLVSPATPMTVPDQLQVSDHMFHDHDPHPTATWTPTDILATSSNIGTILLAQDLGAERVDDYLRRFGFGAPTALDFPGESGGLMLDVDDWSGTSIGSIPLGHGVAVTAMQMLAAYNVLANDGAYVEPRLVQATVDANGTRHEVAPSSSHRVVSETAARQVTDMLVAAVEGGTGTLAAIDGYTVAGKTGTARKPQPGGGYQDAAGNYHYVSTFAGFVPAQDPQLSIIVVMDEPSNGYYASQVSAPVFAELARFGLRQFRVPPPATPYRSTVPEPTVEAAP